MKFKIIIICFILLFSSCGPDESVKNPKDYLLHISISTDINAAISPDGSYLAYYHKSLENPEPEDYPSGLYITDLMTGTRKLLFKGENCDPSWSDDGRYIAFTSQGSLNIITASGDSIRKFTGLSGLNLVTPDWSNDGKAILVSAPLTLEGGVYSITPDFVLIKQILNPLTNNGMNASWSPDRSKIVYSKTNIEQSSSAPDIYIIDTLLTNETRLTNNDEDDRYPVWSNNGQLIAWESETEIFITYINSVTPKKLDYGRFPEWSTSSKQIIYSNVNIDYTKEVIYIIDIDGNNKTQLTF